MEVALERTWKDALSESLSSEGFHSLTSFVKSEYGSKMIFPDPENIFKALNLTPLNKVRVVILGQDPYHGAGQAQGLSFSVPKNTKNPPSLVNIFKELEVEFGKKSEAEVSFGGDLSCWAKQGVLLLNAVLTVEAGKAGSHANKGWEDLTDKIIETVSERCEHVVFMLWGSYAKKKKALIDANKHLILESVHPSPLSAYAGFFNSGHFKRANEWLKDHDKSEINW